MSPEKAKVLIVDSGFGGLSVAQAIMSQWGSQLRLSYTSDTAAFPYGTKDEAWLVERVCKLVDVLVTIENPQVVVIACNTASTVALPELRKNLKIPVVGVVPAIKPAAELTHNHSIALLATPGTVQRSYTQQLVAAFAAACKLAMLGSRELVEIAENKIFGQPISTERIAQICEPLKQQMIEQDADTLVLGCTHFPLIKDELQQVFGEAILFVDSGQAIANRVGSLLELDPKAADSSVFLQQTIYFTKPVVSHPQLQASLMSYGFHNLEFLEGLEHPATDGSDG